MTRSPDDLPPKSRLKALLEHFGRIDDPRQQWKVRHPLPEILLLVVCGAICDCDDYEGIAAWGKAHLPFLREHLPFEHGVPGERWLTILMNRIPPALFADAFTGWVRETWPGVPEQVAIDGKTSRRSHDRAAGKAALHLVSAFATTQRLAPGREAVADKSNETTALPALIGRLAEKDGLKGALVSIDAIATNGKIARTIRDAGAGYLLAVKANQPTLRAETEALFAKASGAEREERRDIDKGHGRIEERIVTLCRDTGWLGRGPTLSRRDAPARRKGRDPRRRAHRTRGPMPHRHPILHLLRRAHRRTGRDRHTRPLGHREQPPLGPRRHLRRRPVPAAKGTRRPEHGRRQTLRPQSRPSRTRQTIHQAPKETSRMGSRLPQTDPQPITPLTSIRRPVGRRTATNPG